MKEGRIDQAGRYSDIANVEAGLMELGVAYQWLIVQMVFSLILTQPMI